MAGISRHVHILKAAVGACCNRTRLSSGSSCATSLRLCADAAGKSTSKNCTTAAAFAPVLQLCMVPQTRNSNNSALLW